MKRWVDDNHIYVSDLLIITYNTLKACVEVYSILKPSLSIKSNVEGTCKDHSFIATSENENDQL